MNLPLIGMFALCASLPAVYAYYIWCNHRRETVGLVKGLFELSKSIPKLLFWLLKLGFWLVVIGLVLAFAPKMFFEILAIVFAIRLLRFVV